MAQHRAAPPSDPWDHLRQVAENHKRLVAAIEAHKLELRAACGQLRAQGATLGEIAAVMGVSPQAIHKYWLPRPGE